MCVAFTFSGPPTSNLGKQQGDTKVVGRLGQTLKLSCPIQAKPEPMIEWGKVRVVMAVIADNHGDGHTCPPKLSSLYKF